MKIQRDLAVALLSITSLRECLDFLLSAAIRLTNYDCGAFYLCDEASGALNLIAHTGLSADFVARVVSYPRDSEPGRMVEAGEMVFGLRSEAPPPMAETLAAEGLEAMIMVPLREKERVIACLIVSSRRSLMIDSSVRIGLQSLVALGEVSIAAMRFRENLLQVERLSHLAVNGANLGIWEMDFLTDGLFLDSRSRSFLGYSENEPLVFQHCLDRIHPDDRESMMADFEKVMLPDGGSEWKCEIRIIHPYQGIRWILGSGQIERDVDGRAVRVTGISMEITERKTSEIMMRKWNESLEKRVAERTSELKQSEDRFKQLADAAFEGIAICENGILLDGNSQLARIHGYELSEMIGRPIANFIAPESQCMVAERIRSGENATYECFGLRKNGSIFPEEIRARILLYQGRKILITALRDLTDAKASEARMLAQQTELEEVQRLALVSEIAAGIIHQVGQPLSSMGANLVTAINGLESCTHAACQSIQVIRKVEEDITRMREIVIHLRSLGDPNRSHRRTCHLNQIIEDVIPILRASALGYGILLNFEFDVNLPPIIADSVQLSQVVLNLVKNAIEASNEQIPERRIIRIRTVLVDQNWVEMSVRDAGVGILPEVQDRLFSPFFSTKTDGLGVGLRLCRTILEAHGGSISGSNNPDGVGATFRLRLPIQSV
jgi:PAS domain S-box-containing protein